MTSQEDRAREADTDTAERRRDERTPLQGTVRMIVETKELEGRAQNISEAGILFFSDKPLRVSVQVDERGSTKHFTGRLVRAQRMKGDQLGWAIELDPA